MQREAVPDQYGCMDPEHKVIYRFVRTLFSAAQLTAECAIVTLVSTRSFLILFLGDFILAVVVCFDFLYK